MFSDFKVLSVFVGDAPHGSSRGPVAVCGFLPWSPEHGQHEHPGTHAGLRSIWLHGQVRRLHLIYLMFFLGWGSDPIHHRHTGGG